MKPHEALATEYRRTLKEVTFKDYPNEIGTFLTTVPRFMYPVLRRHRLKRQMDLYVELKGCLTLKQSVLYQRTLKKYLPTVDN